MDNHLLYLILVPAGVIIGHVGIAAKVFAKVRLLDVTSRWLAHAWFGFVLLCWLVRVRVVGCVIVQGPYDTALSLALVTMLVAIIWEHFGQRRIPLTPLAALVSAAIMGRGRRFDPVSEIVEFDWAWLVGAHAVIAYFAFAILAVNSFFGLRLILGKGEKPKELGPWLGISLRYGFLVFSLMLVSGALASFAERGVLWSFDPMEMMALLLWLVLLAVLLLAPRAHWPEKRLAAVCFGLFFVVVFVYRLVDYLSPGTSWHQFP